MKKLISISLCLCFLLISFSACGKKTEVSINGVQISDEVTAYFKNKAKEGEDYKKLIARYVAINSEFQNHGLEVPGTLRAELSENVNNIWHTYGSYYEKIGVSKETIYKIELSNVYKTLLLEERYGEDGVSPVSEDEIKTYFRENYVTIKFVTGYLFELTEDGTTPLTDEEKKAIIESFDAAASAVNGGSSIEESVALLGEAEVHNTVVSPQNGGNFPEGFFGEVKGLETDKAKSFTLGSYVFLVQRVSGEEGEYECYSEYRLGCLYEMKGEEFEKVIDAWAEQYNS